jgi:hypothetical protein
MKPPRARAESLLVHIASLPDNPDRGLSLLKSKFPYVLSELPRRMVRKELLFGPGESYPQYQVPKDEVEKYLYLVLPLRNRLRTLWGVSDRNTKLMGIMRISQDFFLRGDQGLDDPDHVEADFHLIERPPCRTERLLLCLIDLADYTRRCAASDCPAPYFVASRRSQKYCSRKCAKESQREFKRIWWRNNGKSWRASSGRPRRDS